MLDASALLVGPGKAISTGATDLSELRLAIRAERKVTIHYRDLQETETKRTVWPFALGYLDNVRVLVAWCELRQGFRHFRTDRIAAFAVEEQRYPRRRQSLLKAWREMEGIPPQ
jgi:predicted DNA-binding transcriptional regulator YafY